MIERTIEKAEDGTFYCIDAVTIEYINGENKTLFYIDPNALYETVHKTISDISKTKGDENNPLKKRITQLMRASIKGMLIAFGDDILTMIYGTKDHDKPKRGDDIVDWYQDQFARIAIANMMKNDIVLNGNITYADTNKTVVSVDRFFTRPVTQEKTTTEI